MRQGRDREEIYQRRKGANKVERERELARGPLSLLFKHAVGFAHVVCLFSGVDRPIVLLCLSMVSMEVVAGGERAHLHRDEEEVWWGCRLGMRTWWEAEVEKFASALQEGGVPRMACQR